MNTRAGRWTLPWAVVVVLAMLGVGAAMEVMPRVQLLRHWFLPVRIAQIDIAEHRALYGDGPEEADMAILRRVPPGASRSSARVPENLRFESGSFTVRIDGDGVAGSLSWRLPRADGAASVFWICGNAPSPEAAAVAGIPNHTDVPPSWLPSACRTAP